MGSIRFELPAEGALHANDKHDPLPLYYRPLLGRLYQHRLVMALDLLPAGGRVLEVGVGSGILVPTLTRHFDAYVGVDLVLARDLDRLVHPACRAEFRQADIRDPAAVEPDAFDAAICVSVLEHIGDVGAAARSLARALRPGGTLVAGYPMVSFVMTKAFELMVGYHGIENHHVTAPTDIAGALARTPLRQTARAALPSFAPVSLALYQVTAWTK